jgi:hypothetical protein
MNNISVHRFVYYVLYYSPKTGGKLGRILELILERLILHHISKVVKQNLDIESAVYEAAAYLYTLRSYLSNCRQYFAKKLADRMKKNLKVVYLLYPFYSTFISVPFCISFFLNINSSSPFLNVDLTDLTSVFAGMSTTRLYFLCCVTAFISTESS